MAAETAAERYDRKVAHQSEDRFERAYASQSEERLERRFVDADGDSALAEAVEEFND